MDKIKTPQGGLLTPNQYMDRVSRVEATCEHGHLNCAGWKHGPCGDEIMAQLEEKAAVWGWTVDGSRDLAAMRSGHNWKKKKLINR